LSKQQYPIHKSESEWREKLSAEEYRVLREKGTELPFTGAFNMHFEQGTYSCKACGNPLFTSASKFESSCGWPSYDEALPGALEFLEDRTHGMKRVEIVCAQCGGHQGHVFDDGPTQTGTRYCVNSVSISFSPEK